MTIFYIRYNKTQAMSRWEAYIHADRLAKEIVFGTGLTKEEARENAIQNLRLIYASFEEQVDVTI